MGEEDVSALVRRGEDRFLFEIEKDIEDDLGVDFEDMPILKCDNKCVFCFLHQMPKGLRKTLYYQDDDYRLSFLHGAYVTLTNLSEDEFQRIIDQKLSPMYISVHATDPKLRAELLGRRRATPVLDRIDILAKQGIQMHAQVVLCPGINDGQALKQTVFDLAARHPRVESLGVVPLGLTKFRKNLPKLNPVTRADAAMAIREIRAWQGMLKKRLGTRFVYLGDEMYLMAGQSVPLRSEYDGFPLVENGIGMVRRFIDGFENRIEELENLALPPQRFVLVTGMLGTHFLDTMVKRLNRISWLDARVVPVVNHFLGEGITVSGLLSGNDIGRALIDARIRSDETVLLPPNCLNHNGLFLDDILLKDLEQKVGCRAIVGTYDLVETIQNAVGGVSAFVDAGSEIVVHPYISSHQMEN
jgi:putative radical SAM enzyme (TIGR03279 family)